MIVGSWSIVLKPPWIEEIFKILQYVVEFCCSMGGYATPNKDLLALHYIMKISKLYATCINDHWIERPPYWFFAASKRTCLICRWYTATISYQNKPVHHLYSHDSAIATMLTLNRQICTCHSSGKVYSCNIQVKSLECQGLNSIVVWRKTPSRDCILGAEKYNYVTESTKKHYT